MLRTARPTARILAASLVGLLPLGVSAADIHVHPGSGSVVDDFLFKGTIIIDGPIVEGDYQRFIEAVANAGSTKGMVFIASPGGSVYEAIQIGALIRDLRFETHVPGNGHGGGVCFGLPVSECICASACPLIYLGGVRRAGDYLGIHRTFIQRETLENLSFAEAQSAGRGQAEVVERYLRLMDAPQALFDEMRSIPSGSLRILPQDFVLKYLQNPPDIQEWLNAKCGDWAVIEGRRESLSSDATGNPNADRYECVEAALSRARGEVFYEALFGALRGSDIQQLSPPLRELYEHRVFDIRDFIGQSIWELQNELKWLGLGSIDGRTRKDLVMEGVYNSGGVGVSVADDSRSTVDRLTLVMSHYGGPITKTGMATGATSDNVVEWFGLPVSAGVSVWNEDIVVGKFLPAEHRYMGTVLATKAGDITGIYLTACVKVLDVNPCDEFREEKDSR